MSWNNSFFSFFTKSNHNLEISTQQLHTMYSIIHKNNKDLTFRQFYLYAYLFRNTFKCINILYYFLGYVFFRKTKHIKQVNVVNFVNNVVFIKNTITTSNNLNSAEYLLSLFWVKFKKLKRPTTDLSYFDCYISSYKSKLTKYTQAGFLTLFESFYIVRSHANTLRVLVQVNKPLLLTPKYASSSINKYLSLSSLQGFEFQFLRKNKVYNKGRYSRCRQNYRTGVYMCMYLSVVSIFGLYYWFYKFSFNFTYLWWIFISFVGSFFLPKIIKYRLYEPTTLFSKFLGFFKWFSLLVKSILR